MNAVWPPVVGGSPVCGVSWARVDHEGRSPLALNRTTPHLQRPTETESTSLSIQPWRQSCGTVRPRRPQWQGETSWYVQCPCPTRPVTGATSQPACEAAMTSVTMTCYCWRLSLRTYDVCNRETGEECGRCQTKFRSV